MNPTDDTLSQLTQIIFDHLAIEPDKVKPESRFVEDFNTDSLDAVDLLQAVNEHFRIAITTTEMEQINTVQQFVDAIDKARKLHHK